MGSCWQYMEKVLIVQSGGNLLVVAQDLEERCQEQIVRARNVYSEEFGRSIGVGQGLDI